jgi:hypothetical protein
MALALTSLAVQVAMSIHDGDQRERAATATATATEERIMNACVVIENTVPNEAIENKDGETIAWAFATTVGAKLPESLDGGPSVTGWDFWQGGKKIGPGGLPAYAPVETIEAINNFKQGFAMLPAFSRAGCWIKHLRLLPLTLADVLHAAGERVTSQNEQRVQDAGRLLLDRPLF